MNLPSGGRLVLPWPDLSFIPLIPPLDFPTWAGKLPGNPYFWVLLAGIFSAGALALLFRFGKTPQQKIRLRKRKVFWVPLLFTGTVGTLIAGAMITGQWIPGDLLIYNALGVLAFFFFVFRFPKAAGIPLGIVTSGAVVLLYFLISQAEPAVDSHGVARTRLLSSGKGYWTMEASPRPTVISAKPEGQWIIQEAFRFQTPGLLTLTGAQEWIQLQSSSGVLESLGRWTMETLKWGSIMIIPTPDRPQIFQVYELVKDPSSTWKWRPSGPKSLTGTK